MIEQVTCNSLSKNTAVLRICLNSEKCDAVWTVIATRADFDLPFGFKGHVC